MFDKDTIISEVLEVDPDCAIFFYEIGMHCLSCPMSSGETIEEACAVHGVDCDELLERLNAFVEDKKNNEEK
ncbi:MAG: DUF1858 domain-containing protein [Clostridiales bacterium]|nr:DUF1858 domain-containing protein [Clostridiales bacterium]